MLILIGDISSRRFLISDSDSAIHPPLSTSGTRPHICSHPPIPSTLSFRVRAQIERDAHPRLIPSGHLCNSFTPSANSTSSSVPRFLARPTGSRPHRTDTSFGRFRLSPRPKLRIPSPRPIYRCPLPPLRHRVQGGKFLLDHHTRTIWACLLTTPLGSRAFTKSSLTYRGRLS